MTLAEDRTVTDFAPGLERLFERLPEEASYAVPAAAIEGAVPDFVRGTYYVNGPGRFARGEVRYRHWLDGDGMVCALTFDGAGGARFANRFVRCAKWCDEEAAGRALYRTFGTAFEGDRLVHGIALASPVNVSIYPWAGRLLAYGEQGLPWELDPVTLETRGEHTFGGRLNPVSPFAAHPAFDPETGEMVNFGVSFASQRPTLTLYRFNRAGELELRRRHPLDAPRSVHDFALSRRYAAFYLSPYVFDMDAFMAAGATLVDGLAWRPELGSLLRVFDRGTGDEVAQVDLGDRYCLHLVNAFERRGDDGREQLVLDVVELEEPVYPDYHPLDELFLDVEPGQPVRRVVDLAAGEVVAERRLPYREACDFPNVPPLRVGRPYDEFWMLGISASGKPGRKFFDRLVHCLWGEDGDGGEVRTWTAPKGRYLGGEPVCVPDPAEPTRAAVVCQEYDAEADRGAFVVFDAHDVEAGPVARVPLRSPVPLLFHATFQPAGA
jgi:all-trans-8'-apo-beta-carotenal 15,15'-oxygenase